MLRRKYSIRFAMTVLGDGTFYVQRLVSGVVFQSMLISLRKDVALVSHCVLGLGMGTEKV
ncbi:MAG: hypothetical protein APF81_09765 [Desulfosporosinus sp. BRH_c37]|nr:MAG: hypothetical protein APF81_09765 [Desulfosporosinus sp. BRH_c37]